MKLWDTRNQALTALEGDLLQEAETIASTFGDIDLCIRLLSQVNSPFARVSNLALIKARNLAQASYSLTLDGLAQEAGALLRPLIEALELLVFLRQDPSRVEMFIDGRLPPPGKIAQEIQGEFHELRDYLSKHSAHFGFTAESLLHVIDLNQGTLILNQPYVKSVLRTNLGALFLFLIRLAFEAVNCLSLANTMLVNDLGDAIQKHRDTGMKIFFNQVHKPTDPVSSSGT